MIVLGIDPGTVVTGYGLIKLEDNLVRPIHFGVIRMKSKSHLHTRLKKIYDELTKIIQANKPEAVALEGVFYSRNVKTALHIGHARGAAILAAENYGIHVHEYSPRQVKQAVTGKGAASKEQVQLMTQRLLHMSDPPTPLDTSDALAIAICHLIKTEKCIRF
ncbi:MAG: crossover junction endodeoxyribonuclease RuvC [Candidatus Cloacimonetes bacterium 4572_55]|nr:MAG: crossover junction endodeoxyribonuclease RuvC [Candidatus Cloacimonetes bacterium 4572_55]